MYKSFSMELAGRTLTVDVGRVAAQANGAAFMHYGDTTVLSTATASEKPRDGIDFFPLSVEYEEKLYAVGKIPGGFNKREGKASENAILTSRVIDRPMRPLFPKDYRNDVTLNNMVMSVDPECAPELTAMLGSAIAVAISDIPFDGPCATTQVGLINGEFVINPNASQNAVSDLKLTVASTRDKVIMIEAGANEVPEAKMVEAIYKAQEATQTRLPKEGTVLFSVSRKDKPEVVDIAKTFEKCGFHIVATGTTYELLIANGIKADRINKMQEGRPNIVDAVMNGKIQLIINTPATQEEKVFDDSYVRKTAIRAKVPYMTTMAAARATAEGIEAVLKYGEIGVMSLQEIHKAIQ